MKEIFSSIKETLSVDLRSLALFRICAGILIIYDLIDRSRFLSDHYTDDGVLPVDMLHKVWKSYYWTFHDLSGEFWYEALLFITAGVLAIFLILGYKTRYVTILIWIITISMHYRNPMLLNGGDKIFRVLIFWCIFLPWGARYSIDSALNTAKKKLSNSYISFAGIAFLLQLPILYTMSAIEKSGADWTDGKAIFYALNLDVYAKSTADWLLAFPELMVLLTHGTWYLELFAGFIIFVPYFNTQLRIFTILLFIGFHLSLYFFLVLGLFPWVMMAGWLGYIPTKVWDGLLNKVDKGLEPIQVFVNPQNTAVKKVLLVFITMMGVRKVSLEEDQDMTTVNWCVSDHQKKVYGKDAYKKLISRSFYYLILPEFLKLSVLKSLMLGMYNRSFKSIALIKSKFLWYSKYSSIYGVSYNIIGGVFLFLALFSAAQKAGATKALDLNGNKVATHMNTMINYSHIYQYWGMFAPNVPKSSGWYVLPAVLKDGTELDMLTGEKVTYEKPSLPANQYTNDRHRNYMSNKMRSKKFKKLRRRFVEVLAENWNEKQSSEDKELKEFKLMFMLENTEPHKQTLLQLARYELRNGDPLIIISKKY